MLLPVGAISPFTTCPYCSILVAGSCVPCSNGDTHPSCLDCRDGRFRPPWYKSELFQTVSLSVAIGVVTALIVRHIEIKLSQRRR